MGKIIVCLYTELSKKYLTYKLEKDMMLSTAAQFEA